MREFWPSSRRGSAGVVDPTARFRNADLGRKARAWRQRGSFNGLLGETTTAAEVVDASQGQQERLTPVTRGPRLVAASDLLALRTLLELPNEALQHLRCGEERIRGAGDSVSSTLQLDSSRSLAYSTASGKAQLGQSGPDRAHVCRRAISKASYLLSVTTSRQRPLRSAARNQSALIEVVRPIGFARSAHTTRPEGGRCVGLALEVQSGVALAS